MRRTDSTNRRQGAARTNLSQPSLPVGKQHLPLPRGVGDDRVHLGQKLVESRHSLLVLLADRLKLHMGSPSGENHVT